MKRYVWCFLLFCTVTAVCVLTVFWMAGRASERKQMAKEQEYQMEQEYVAADQMEVSHASEDSRYYLAEQSGMVMVFEADQRTVHMSTHMPLKEFPAEEQEKLKAGLWFSTMMEIYSYLESSTS